MQNNPFSVDVDLENEEQYRPTTMQSTLQNRRSSRRAPQELVEIEIAGSSLNPNTHQNFEDDVFMHNNDAPDNQDFETSNQVPQQIRTAVDDKQNTTHKKDQADINLFCQMNEV